MSLNKIIIFLLSFLFPLTAFAGVEKSISMEFPDIINQGQKIEVPVFLELEDENKGESKWQFEPLIKILEKQGSIEEEFMKKKKIEKPRRGWEFKWNFKFTEPGDYIVGFKFRAYKDEEYKYTFDKRDVEDISLEFKVEKRDEEVEKINSKKEEIKELLSINDIENITEEQKSVLDEEINNWEIAFEGIFTSTNLDEKHIVNAEPYINEMTNRAVIHIKLNNQGSEILRELTKENIGKSIAIYLNEERIQRATIQEEISGGQIQISGNLNEDEANQIAEKLGYTTTITVEETKHKLELNSGTSGNIVNPGEGIFNYNWGDEIELKVKPKPGYKFIGWNGDVDNISDPNLEDTTIAIKGNYSILAEFQKKKYPLIFSEENGLEGVSIEIYSYEDFTGKVNEITTSLDGEVEENFETGKYWFIAKLENYEDYKGSFEVEKSSKSVNFTMKEKSGDGKSNKNSENKELVESEEYENNGEEKEEKDGRLVEAKEGEKDDKGEEKEEKIITDNQPKQRGEITEKTSEEKEREIFIVRIFNSIKTFFLRIFQW
ncbi:MAG: SecDF P1 head subdomain-containing protein [Patescibacteria group bacterium]